MESKKRNVLIIITLIVLIGVPGGWYLYEKKKESDRQALLNMGNTLKKASADYEKEVARINSNQAMAEEYTKLMESILDKKVSSSDLQKTKVRVCEMEKKLMSLYPTIYNEPSSVCR